MARLTPAQLAAKFAQQTESRAGDRSALRHPAAASAAPAAPARPARRILADQADARSVPPTADDPDRAVDPGPDSPWGSPSGSGSDSPSGSGSGSPESRHGDDSRSEEHRRDKHDSQKRARLGGELSSDRDAVWGDKRDRDDSRSKDIQHAAPRARGEDAGPEEERRSGPHPSLGGPRPPRPGPLSDTSTRRSGSLHPILRRGKGVGRLRGHPVPKALHGRAARAKMTLELGRGSRLSWDEVMQEALDLLAGDRHVLVERLRRPLVPIGSARMVQATIRPEQDQWLRALKLDLDEADLAVRYEQLWTLALEGWTTKYAGPP